MSFDNRVLNVNGETKEELLLAITLAFTQDGRKTAKAWKVEPDHGLVFYWWENKDAHPFPVPLDANGICEIAWQWLQSDEGKSVPSENKLDHWFKDLNHDGSNIKGWRAYTEDWGHVNRNTYAIVAIHRSYLWLGK